MIIHKTVVEKLEELLLKANFDEIKYSEDIIINPIYFINCMGSAKLSERKQMIDFAKLCIQNLYEPMLKENIINRIENIYDEKFIEKT